MPLPQIPAPSQAQQGDGLRSSGDEREQAWRTLVDTHYARVYRLVSRFGVAPAEVEDLVQRSLVIAFQRITEVEDLRDPGAWLRGIAVRVVAQHRRWRAVREAKRWLLGESPACPEPVVTPEQDLLAAEDIGAVRETLLRLSPKLRDVLVLCEMEEFKPSEVAQLLGVSVNTIGSRRRLAKAKFLSLWKQREPS